MKRITVFIVIATLVPLLVTTPVKAQDNNPPVYIVQPGETLTTVANEFGVSLQDLIQANNISNPDIIDAGSQLIIPGLNGIHGTLTTSTVQLGENLPSLGLEYGLAKDMLVQLNRITSPSEIYAGASFILPQNKDSNSISMITTQSGNSILDEAAQLNVNPWILALNNGKQNLWDVIPGENMYYLPSSNESQNSLVSTQIKAITISPLPMVQGETEDLQIKTTQPVTLSGTLNSYPLHFFQQAENEYVALQGIDVTAQPGLSLLHLTGKNQDGSSFTIDQSLLLEAGNFITDPPLTVDPSTIDPNLTGPEDKQVLSIVTPATPDKLWDGQWQPPLKEPAGLTVEDCIESPFGTKRTYNGGSFSDYHTGMDIGVCSDDLTIYAAANGIVAFTGLLTVRGNTTIINNGWGVYTAYYHQSKINVQVGESVTAGQPIGVIGATGRVTGPHLHFEVWVNQHVVQPLDWLNHVYP